MTPDKQTTWGLFTGALPARGRNFFVAISRVGSRLLHNFKSLHTPAAGSRLETAPGPGHHPPEADRPAGDSPGQSGSHAGLGTERLKGAPSTCSNKYSSQSRAQCWHS